MDATAKYAAQQQVDKEAAYMRDAFGPGLAGSGSIGGAATCGMPAEYRQSMRDRFQSKLNEAERQSQRAEKLRELVFLLDKNPEVARILDLFDQVQ